MRWPEGRGRTCLFAVYQVDGEWQVAREMVRIGRFQSRGDAVREACLRARGEEKRGRRARVIAQPGDLLVPHYEAHFGA